MLPHGRLWAVITTALSLAPTRYRVKARIELRRTYRHNEDQRCHIPYNQLTLQAVNTPTFPAGAFIILTGRVKNPVTLETNLNLLYSPSILNNTRVRTGSRHPLWPEAVKGSLGM